MDSMKKKTSGFLAALFLAAGMASCGDPEGFGLGEVIINDGGSQAVEFGGTDAVGCDFSDSIYFVSVLAFKNDADLGGIVFGSDTILDIQEAPPDTEPLANANVVIFNVPRATFPGDFFVEVSHSNNPNANFFSDPSLILNTTDEIGTFSTGDNAISWLGFRMVSGPTVASDEDRVFTVDILGAKGGDGFQVEFNFSCAAP